VSSQVCPDFSDISCLNFQITALKKINITVKKGDTSFPLCVDNVWSVKHLKESIEYKEGTVPSKQILQVGHYYVISETADDRLN
jgi:hypothetical protein